MTERFNGQVVVITGAARGLGRDYARYFAHDGANVVIADVAGMDSAVKDVSSEHQYCLGIRTDVTSQESVEAMVFEAVQAFGRIDILINNAGLWRDLAHPLLEGSLERWDAAWRVNVDGTLHCYQAVAPLMVRQGSGRIVNISSMAARSGEHAYGLTKNCVEQMTRGMAIEMGPHRVTVNCVAPGISAFEKAASSIPNADEVVAGNAIARLGTSRDLYEALAFLCSAHASWITGQTLRVDGGAGL